MTLRDRNLMEKFDMRNKLIFALPLALMATPALAQSQGGDVTGTVDIDGSVEGRCLFTTDNAVIHLGELALGGTGATAGKLDTSKVNGQTATLIGWCNNTSATMSVETTELTNSATAPTGFDNRIDYTATATNPNSDSASDSSLTAGAGTPTNVGMFTGDIDVELSTSSTPNGGLLVAGDYTGNVVVTLSPNFAPPT